MIKCKSETDETQTSVLFPLRRCLTLILLFFSFLLMIFGGLTSPVNESYYYVMYWTLAAFFLFVSILIGIYDTAKTYMEIRLSCETSAQNGLQTGMKK
ncbi:MAG: hypothetical protein LBL62_02755 [Planctomycetaceae bacterium]|jgi:uncharacterized ion transporter superfamily protein YfcC|nr:hypothetical protein [Planctomycetaceae bacterium]